jgi:hypothetical protein
MQPSLAYFEPKFGGQTGKIMLFDGQHKAAAQLYNLSDDILCRVFVPANNGADRSVDSFVEELVGPTFVRIRSWPNSTSRSSLKTR